MLTIILSLLSNIITSVICYYLKISELLEERIQQITEIKNEKEYLTFLKKFFRRLNIIIIIYFIIEIIIIILLFVYIIIFCIIYNKSQISLLINYMTSLFEDLFKDIIISIIIVLGRKIGIYYLNPYIYNASKFINSHF
jgi:hypothetical protein